MRFSISPANLFGARCISGVLPEPISLTLPLRENSVASPFFTNAPHAKYYDSDLLKG